MDEILGYDDLTGEYADQHEIKTRFKLGDLVMNKDFAGMRGVVVGIHAVRVRYGAGEDVDEYSVRCYFPDGTVQSAWMKDEWIEPLL